MKLSLEKVKSLCYRQNTSVGNMLREAGVSRNAFYTLARNDTVVPRSLTQIADRLDVPVSELLTDTVSTGERMRTLITDTNRIAQRHSDMDRDTVRHTLLLLNEDPWDRLRRALRRGRSFNFR